MADQTQQEFLKELGVEEKKDVLEEPLIEGDEPVKEETPEEEGMKAKNRRERRLLEQNQQLREEAIAATARLQGIAEARKFSQEVGEEDPLKSLETIFGTDTPEKKEATDVLRKAFENMTERAIAKSFEKIEAERGNEAQELRKEEKTLDEIADRVEDDHGIDMSDDADRAGYFTLLEKLSPKDQDGNIIEYADPDSTAEIYLSRKQKANSRAKDLASRSMTPSGASQDSKLEVSAAERFLKENGII